MGWAGDIKIDIASHQKMIGKLSSRIVDFDG
jgi:hypothetical protein